VLAIAPHVAAIVDRDPTGLWTHVTPESSRRLLMAALDAFAALGFEGATTREIAGRADMSPAAVYVHYKAKLDLLQEICEVAHRAVWESVATALQGVDGPTARLRVFAEAFAAWHACNHTLGRVANYELPSLPEERMTEVGAVRRRFETLVRNELRRGIHDEDFTVPDLRGTTRAILSLGIDLVRWYAPEHRISVEDIAQLHGELVLRMVRPWDGAQRHAAANGHGPA
jgi:AcrR family transcriptional regulator